MKLRFFKVKSIRSNQLCCSSARSIVILNYSFDAPVISNFGSTSLPSPFTKNQNYNYRKGKIIKGKGANSVELAWTLSGCYGLSSFFNPSELLRVRRRKKEETHHSTRFRPLECLLNSVLAMWRPQWWNRTRRNDFWKAHFGANDCFT